MALTFQVTQFFLQAEHQRLVSEARRINGQLAAVLMRHGQQPLPPGPPHKTIWEHLEEDLVPTGDAP